MNVLSVSILIIAIVFSLYNLLIWRMYGILDSISASYYSLGKKNSKFFVFFTWLLVVPLAVIGGVQPMEFSGAMFMVSAIGFAFVGAAGAFKLEEMTKIVHYIGAGIGIAAALAGLVAANTGLWYLPIAFALASFVLFMTKAKNIIYWIEIIAFVFILFGLLLLL